VHEDVWALLLKPTLAGAAAAGGVLAYNYCTAVLAVCLITSRRNGTVPVVAVLH
jgi:hypothetical protein